MTSDVWRLVFISGLAALVLVMCLRIRHQLHGTGLNSTAPFSLHIFIEDRDLSCDFVCRMDAADLSSMVRLPLSEGSCIPVHAHTHTLPTPCFNSQWQDVLLEAISRAAFEATDVPFDFGVAHVLRVDNKGKSTDVLTDKDCMTLHKASGLRVYTDSKRYRAARARRKQHAGNNSSSMEKSELLPIHEEDELDPLKL